MNKRKILMWFKENWIWITFIIWVIISGFFIFTVNSKDSSVISKVILGIIFVLVTIILFGIGPVYYIGSKHRELEDMRKRIQELEVQYKKYVDIVNVKVKEILNKYNIDLEDVYIDKSFAYLISFSNKLEWVKNYRITGEPDSFIIASCLMYGIIGTDVIELKKHDEKTDSDFKKRINIELAMNCALEIISEPITYYEGNGVWVGAKHPKVIISIPKGLIKEEDLFHRIKKTIYTDDELDNRTSIMQFSNLLHLIYLNCLNSQ